MGLFALRTTYFAIWRLNWQSNQKRQTAHVYPSASCNFLPLHLIIQNHAVGCIFGCKGFALILHAEHHEWFCTIVANGALAVWCYSHHASLLNWEYLAIHLELALAAEEEIQFLVVLVGVEETCLCARSKALE